MKTWSKIKIDGDDVWTQTPKKTKSLYNKLNKLNGDDLRLEIAKPFFPKYVLKMTKKIKSNISINLMSNFITQ